MIEFSGYISGAAKKFRQIKGAQFLYSVMGCVYLVFTPFAIALYLGLKTWVLLVLYACLIGLVAVYPLFPLDKNTEKNFTANRVFIDEEYIVAKGEKFEVFHLISEAVSLLDYGEFYFVKFPMGKKSEHFICQKNLLTKGTLEEFEACFEGKVVRIEK